MQLIILPHQLYEISHIKKACENVEIDMAKISEILLWEHPHYFKSYNYNKKKLMLHRASMRYYADYLGKQFSTTFSPKIIYIEFADSLPKLSSPIIFDPIDKNLKNIDYKKWQILESPNFLLTCAQYEKYRKEKTDKFYFKTLYDWGRKQIDLIPNEKSRDTENRAKIPANITIPKMKNYANTVKSKKYINEAKTYVEKHFARNLGNTDAFIFPITHVDAMRLLQDFIKTKFKNFGKYQDAIHKDNNTLFHSLLSSSLNCGLLNPSDVITEIEKNRSKIPINSYEGFVRQLFWREFQRFNYIYNNFSKLNYFGNKKKLTKEWYKGELGIPPVDDAIHNAINTAYLHHIERLMIIGNFMNLSGISPSEGHRWFMEFSIDSYEWVMMQNVYDMVFFNSGGKTMKRPYISSSNYILKMSNYSCGDWCDEWNKLYKEFLKNKKSKLYKFRYYFRGL